MRSVTFEAQRLAQLGRLADQLIRFWKAVSKAAVKKSPRERNNFPIVPADDLKLADHHLADAFPVLATTT